MLEDKAFLGRGWGFSPAFDKLSGEVLMLEGADDIVSSLEILLSTRPGERVMQPDYGCNLDVLLFEPLTTTLVSEVKDIIETAIMYYEPRITLEDIDISMADPHQGLVLIEIEYTVRETNSRFNFVYPFYLNEGTNIL